ncbi:aliphatic sulfonate ABC transporter substrate-binding protein [Paludibacterium denitrificans]|uniref:aliphatic sulfonate ABC transporter substrate-binding protein n=1 Tax=Paludibacterium denitrificans TaxID=2675226 RepID=UPI001E3EE8BE|nr:aliphatic sulfonate ABC transporter substrate-binding protein [Paludibacterium denitrificans]
MNHVNRPRRGLLGLLAVLGVSFALSTNAWAAKADPLRIGYQKYGSLVLLKARGTLEKRLAPLGVEVKWTEFPAGPQLLEGLNVGSVDFGTTGETPPIFARAAGANLLYIANEPPSPAGEGIVVRKDSPIRSVKDLKGKRVVLNKGSNVHYLLVKALQKAGLKYSDITPVYLPPADARAAFERGSVDALGYLGPILCCGRKTDGGTVGGRWPRNGE